MNNPTGQSLNLLVYQQRDQGGTRIMVIIPDLNHNTRFKEWLQVNLSFTGQITTPTSQQFTAPITDQFTAMVANVEESAQLDDGTNNFSYPSAFQNNVLHYGDMLQAPDCQQFVTAMEDEVNSLQDTFEILPRSAMPKDTKHLPVIWAFKRKC
jgi:hypothetical protein